MYYFINTSYTLLQTAMLTRLQARRSGIVVVDTPLPNKTKNTGKKAPRKTAKKRRGEDNIDSSDVEVILAEIATMPVSEPSILKKQKTSSTKKVQIVESVEKPVMLLNPEPMPEAPAIAKPWAKWQPFLRKLFKNEPTDQQYELANAIWEHILKTANGAMLISDRPIIRLYRDFRGGSPAPHLIDMITDPKDVVIKSRSDLIGIGDRPMSVYLEKDNLESAMWCLEKIGWMGKMYDPNDYSSSMNHVFI